MIQLGRRLLIRKTGFDGLTASRAGEFQPRPPGLLAFPAMPN